MTQVKVDGAFQNPDIHFSDASGSITPDPTHSALEVLENKQS